MVVVLVVVSVNVGCDKGSIYKMYINITLMK